jgi:hypothetical protein
MNVVLPIELRAADDVIDGTKRDALRPGRARGGKEPAVSKKEMLVILAMLAFAVLALVGRSAVAHAQPTQQFSVRLHGSPGGQISVGITARIFDTTGAVPPPMTAFYARIPAGIGVPRPFLRSRYYCNGPALRLALDARPTGAPFAARVANLRPFIRSLAHSRSRADRAALANARVCDRARLGGGTALIDGRRVTAALSDLIPVRFSIFLSRGTVPDAIAGFTIVGAADEKSPIVRRFPILAGVHATLTDNILDDPTPDGLYGYKVVLPTGRIGGLDVSVAEVHATVHALEIPKRTCLKTDRRGRCTARQKTSLFSFTFPKCPSSGQLSALVFVGYAAPTPSSTTTLQLPCPRFSP